MTALKLGRKAAPPVLIKTRRPLLNLPIVTQSPVGLFLILISLLGAPLIFSTFKLTLFCTAVAYSVATLGMALGFASVEMLALTQPAIMAIGGFTCLYLMTGWNWPFVLSAPAAIVVGMLVSLPLGWLAVNLDRFSFAILGFAFTYLIDMLFSSSLFIDVTGGELGKAVPPGAILGVSLAGVWGYAFVSTLAFVAFAFASLMFRSTFGRMLLAMRQDNVVTNAMGANSSQLRIVLTVIVSGYGALSGVLIGQAGNYLAPPQFGISLSIALLAMALIGGASYLAGAFIGTILLQAVLAMFDLQQVDRDLASGGLLLVCLIFFPKGILGAVDHTIDCTIRYFRRSGVESR